MKYYAEITLKNKRKKKFTINALSMENAIEKIDMGLFKLSIQWQKISIKNHVMDYIKYIGYHLTINNKGEIKGNWNSTRKNKRNSLTMF